MVACVTVYAGLKPLVDDGIRHTGNIGSHFYMGPEQAAGKKYDQKVDIYSLGVIFFELHHPFDTEMERVKVFTTLHVCTIDRSGRVHVKDDMSIYKLAPLGGWGHSTI